MLGNLWRWKLIFVDVVKGKDIFGVQVVREVGNGRMLLGLSSMALFSRAKAISLSFLAVAGPAV